MKLINTVLLTILIGTISACGFAKSDEERLSLAEDYMASGDYRTASIEVKNVLNNDPVNADARSLLATILLGLNDVLGAEKEFQRATEYGAVGTTLTRLRYDIWEAKGEHLEILASLGRDDVDLPASEQSKYRGNALIATGDGESARATFEEWLAADPDSVDAMVGLARAKAVAGQRDEAIDALMSIVSQHPDRVDAWLALGNFQFAAGDYEPSKKAYAKSIENSLPQQNVRRYLFTLSKLADVQLLLQEIDAARLTINRLAGYAPSAPQTLFLQARLAQLEEDYYEAARALTELRQIQPNDVGVLMSLGNVHWRLGNFGQAQALYERVVTLAPDNLQARKQLAAVRLRQNDTGSAVDVLVPLLDEYADDPDLYALMAAAEVQSGNQSAAIERLSEALRKNPGDRSLTIRLAEAYRRIGDPEKSIELLADLPMSSAVPFSREQVLINSLLVLGSQAEADRVGSSLLAHVGDDAAALVLVAELKMRLGQANEARGLLEEARRLDDNNLSVLLSSAALELGAGNTSLAKQTYEQILREQSPNLTAMLALAQIANDEGDSSRSIELLEQARREFSDAIAPRLVLSRLYLADSRADEADVIAREITALGSTEASVLEELGRIFLDTGSPVEAESQFRLAVERDPGSVAALLGLARALMSQGKTVESQAMLERVLEIDPQSTTANSVLALASLRAGNPDEAERRIRQFLMADPDNPAANAVQGEIYYQRGDFAQAAAAFKEAADNGGGVNAVIREFQTRVEWKEDLTPETTLVAWLDDHPEDTLARIHLAQHYQRNASGEDAISEYELLLAGDPDNAAYLNNLAVEYQRVGHIERAIELAERANQLQPDTAEFMDTLGWIYRDAGKLAESAELLGRAARLLPENSEIRYHYAVSLSENGNTESAREVLKGLLAADSQFPSREQAEALMGEL